MRKVYRIKKLISRYSSSFSKNNNKVGTIISYSNADIQKLSILEQNKNKIGIYM
jgi:hypothetical protein